MLKWINSPTKDIIHATDFSSNPLHFETIGLHIHGMSMNMHYDYHFSIEYFHPI